MKKTVLIVFIILIILSIILSAGIYYLNTSYLPKVIKTKITQEIPKKFNINIQLDDIKFNIFKGVVFSNIKISAKDDPNTVLQIERISTSFLILPLFNQGKFILPSVTIYRPKVDVIRYEGNRFNVQSLIPKPIDAAKEPSGIAVLIYRIDIQEAEINFLDKTIEPSFSQNININNITAQISPLAVNFNGRGILSDKNQKSSLSFSGNFNFQKKELKMNSRLDKLDALPYLAYSKELPVSLKSLKLNGIESEINLIDDVLYISAKSDIKDLNLITGAYLTKDKTLLNNASAKLESALVFDFKKESNFKFLITIDDLVADLVTPRVPDKIKIEYAKFDITPKKIEIKNSKIKGLETYFTIKGVVENFSDPIVDIKIQTKVDLLKAKDFLKDFFDFMNPIVVSGKADINLNVLKAKGKKDIEFAGSFNLENSSIRSTDMPYEISAINGLINFDKDKIEWSNLTFNLLGKSFYSKAAIQGLKSPLINLELYSDKLNVLAKISLKQRNNFYIENLKASYYNSRLNASGSLELIDKNNSYIDLNLESHIDLRDLKEIDNLPQEQILNFAPEGKISAEGRIKGNARNPQALNSILNITSEKILVRGFSLSGLTMQLVQENQQIKIPQSICNFYDGTLALNGLIDLEEESYPYALKLVCENVNLRKLKLDIPIEDENLSGAISSTVILSGQMDSLQDVKAQGEFTVTDGYLWGFNPLGKLGDFLFIPKYKTITFEQAEGQFNIFNRKIALENVVLTSDILLLSCEGTIDFAGNLDLDMAPKPISDNTENLDEYEKFFAGIFSETGGVVSVKITGTVQKPKFEKKVIALRVMDKVKNEVVDKVRAFTDLIFGSPEE
jgi:hypothetical protein